MINTNDTKPNTNNFSNCQPGDKLWYQPTTEYVFVVEVNIKAESIKVKTINNDFANFKLIQDPKDQVLYFDKPTIIAPPEPIRPILPDVEPGTILWVRNDNDHPFQCALFSNWHNRKAVCYTLLDKSDLYPYSQWQLTEIQDIPLKNLLLKALTSIDCTKNWLNNGSNVQDAIQELHLMGDKIKRVLKNENT